VCGICGTIGFSSAAAVEDMISRLRHRGPDDEGLFFDSDAEAALAAARLSIIDVAGGHQPLSNEDGTVWAVLNGEIYNHSIIRSGLRERGHQFASRCDTEALVHLYEEYGDALVHALEGMYSFALWDRDRRRLLLVRDRFGEKPMFYWEQDGTLAFASELGALEVEGGPRREPDPVAVDEFFVFGYVPGPASIVKGVRQLPPAHILKFEHGAARATVERYWSPAAPIGAGAVDARDAARETDALLESSIRSRMIADVPVGVLLSGGVDSTLIAAIAAQASGRPISTFTVGYGGGEFDETREARDAASRIGSDHHELTLTPREVARVVPSLLRRIDQPLSDQSLIAAHAVSRFARSEVKVLVGGEGADELFCGYPRYRWLERAERLGDLVPPRVSTLSARLLRAVGDRRADRLARVIAPVPSLERHLDWVTDGRSRVRGALYGPRLRPQIAGGWPLVSLREASMASDSSDGSVAGRFMALDQAHWLPDDVLVKADRASMLASIELRTPYLDRDLAEFAAAVPASQHLGSQGKTLLRETLKRRLGRTAARRSKTAFRVPAANWLRGPLSSLLELQLREGRLFSDGWFMRQPVERLAAEHAAGEDRASVLWPLLCLGLWLDGADDNATG